jgi:lipoprotein-anchoring transpeptidase ErfK/SrfK
METKLYPPPPAARQRRPKAKQSNQTLWLVGGAAAVSAIMIVIAGFALLFMLTLMPDRIASGVAVAGITLGGKTSDEASAALQQNLTSQTVRLTDGEREFSTQMNTLGISFDAAATLQAAEDASANTNLAPRYAVDLGSAQAGFVGLSEEINIDAIPNRDGRSMDIPVMLDRLRADAVGELADGVFELNMITVPAPTPETVPSYTGATTRHTVEQGQELGLISKTYNVSITDIMALNEIANPDLIYPGQELVIPAEGVYVPPAPAAPTNVGRSIVVSTETQRIYAYENGQMVRSQIVSTGLPATPTVKGDFAVYVKYVADDMSGPDYFLPQVPYTMYFYQGYAIHGTYWHNAFGRPMSHGCVNLPTDEAQWFFNFASVGTPVRVI